MSTLMLCACQPSSAPKSKTSSTQNLLAQVEAIEVAESRDLFIRAKAAAEKDDIKEAKSLIQQALGRGAGSNGMGEAETEIKAAENRIAERERARQRRLDAALRKLEASMSSSVSSSSNNSTATEDAYCLNASFSADVKY